MAIRRALRDLSGKLVGEVELPQQFEEGIREDLIRRAVAAEQSTRRQPKGVDLLAGFRTTAQYYGRRRQAYRTTICTGRSRLRRIKMPKGALGAVRVSPHAVKGHRAHPPKPWKRIIEKINQREHAKAIRSALAAAANTTYITMRGHRWTGDAPLIIVDELEELRKTKEVKKALGSLGLSDELRASEKVKRRSGVARRRGRVKKVRKSILIIINNDRGIAAAAAALPGVDVVNVRSLSCEHLAPGGLPGRLCIITSGALAALRDEGLYRGA